MRKVSRLPLDGHADRYLSKRRGRILSIPKDHRSGAIEGHWKTARTTKIFRTRILAVLGKMAGKRQRCMFCNDSRGNEVEHFHPKNTFPEQAFDWVNMLLACGKCQKDKGAAFPMDGQGRALLIDPTSEDPWDFLLFVPETGMLTAKYDKASGGENPKGKLTIEMLHLHDEVLNDGRKETFRRISDAVKAFLEKASASPLLVDDFKSKLIDTIRHNQDYGLAYWIFVREEYDHPRLRQLKSSYVAVHHQIVTTIQ